MNPVSPDLLESMRTHAQSESPGRAWVRLHGGDLCKLRMEANRTQVAVAKHAQVPQRYISLVESCDPYGISDEALMRILEVYSNLEKRK